MPYLAQRRRSYKRKGYKVRARESVREPAMELRYRASEMKAISVAFTVDPNTTGAIVNLTAVSQGDTVASRIGNQIHLRSIQCGGTITGGVGGSVGDYVRMMIVRDNLGTTDQPTIGDMFVTVAVFLNNQPPEGDPQSVARFTVIMDKFVVLSVGQGLRQTFTFKRKLNSACLFSGTGSTDEGKGALYLFIASSSPTNDPIVAANSLIHFTDS